VRQGPYRDTPIRSGGSKHHPGPTADRSRQRHSTGSATGQAAPRGGATPSSQFGYKAQVVDNTDGVILDYTVEQGNPADAPQLAPAIARVTARAGRPPDAVTADRGYGEARVEADVHALGVPTVVIPRKGPPGPARQAVEHRPSFRALVKWRTGCEGRIAHLKRRSGRDRTLLDGLAGARTWCGHGVFTHNLTKISGLAA